MTTVNDLINRLPIDELAAKVGADPQQTRSAIAAILPALVGGMDANAQSDSGAQSLTQALGEHTGALVDGGVNVDDIDPSQGSAIVKHVFGSSRDQVADQLGALNLSGGSVGSSLIKRLLPYLAPIVMSYLSNLLRERLGGGSSGQQASPASQPDQSEQAHQPAPHDQAPSSSSSNDGQLLPGAGGSGSGSGPGSLQDMLNSVLGAGASSDTSSSDTSSSDSSAPERPSVGGVDVGDLLNNVLGGLLGGGRK